MAVLFRSPAALKIPPFSIPASIDVWKLIESASAKSHHDSSRTFADFLTLAICALSGGQMEDEYRTTVAQYTEGKPGERACDDLASAFGVLARAMDDTRADILGDLYMGGVSRGRNGQYFTPESICEVMAHVSMPETASRTRRRVYDPACGSGRLLLAAAKLDRNNQFFGQDIDIRCVHMTALNLALWNLDGYVVHGDSLKGDVHAAYRTGFRGKGVIERVEDLEPLRKMLQRASADADRRSSTGVEEQLQLF